ncbi:hypothetical protein VTK26DRAFT_3235 [Humicola hyalothermophila]
MADPEPEKVAAEDGQKQSSTDSAQAPGPGLKPESKPEAKPSPASTTSSPAGRPLYVPQFTAATQMILKRMKGEPSSLSAALSQASRSPSVTANIPSATYEDVRRRLIMGMNTSAQMTMQMPTPPSARSPSTTTSLPKPAPVRPTTSTTRMSAIRKVTAGLTSISKSTIKSTTAKAVSSEIKVKKTKVSGVPRVNSNKRKRTKTQEDDDGDDASSLSSSDELSESEPPSERATPSAPLTMTKSGRQIQKPLAYNPAAMDAASRKRPNYGKRTAEQALCKKCTRMHSPATNQMVFCDGCNEGWHQLCHEPWIHDDVVRDQNRTWFCGACQEKRDRERQHHQHHSAKKQKLSDQARPLESWASRPPQQKRAYLSTLPQQELVALIMSCLELHPDLPIFPALSASAGSDTPTSHSASGPRSLFAGTTTEGLFPRVDANPTGQMNFVRKVAGGANNKRNGSGSGSGKSQKEDSQERKMAADEEDDEFDPLAPLWPKPGMGLYSRLPPDTADEERLVDEGDYEAFSVIVYDEKGRKVEENGMKV